MLETLLRLCETPAVSGREEALRALIESQVKDYADCRVDALGNLIVHKQGAQRAAKKVLLDAHMDEVGLIVTGANDDGTLTFATVGGIDVSVLMARRVVSYSGVYGVTLAKPVHLLDADERKKLPKKDTLVIDIGAKDREEALRIVPPGEVFAFDSEPVRFGDNRLKARAIDDRAGCAVLLQLIKTPQPYDLTFSFSVQEEVGLRGARTAAYGEAPDAALVLEATTAADLPGAEGAQRVCCLGGGPAVSFLDSATLYERGLYRAAFDAAQRIGVPCQPKTAATGGNDAGAIHTARGGVRTLALSLPCRYLHSACCVIDCSDLEATAALAAELAAQLASGAV